MCTIWKYPVSKEAHGAHHRLSSRLFFFFFCRLCDLSASVRNVLCLHTGSDLLPSFFYFPVASSLFVLCVELK